MTAARVGVLALQGDFEAHQRILRAAGAEAIAVRTREELESVDRLVIPGGESTTIGKLAADYDLIEPLRKRAEGGMPVLGTCAGLIVCARRIEGGMRGEQPLLGIVDVTVRRNAFGRQVDSFETDLDVKGIDSPVHAVFIRAPWIEQVGAAVEVLAQHGGRPVAARQGRVLVCSFHPELTGDERIHRLFLEL
ncbi:MAG TPA: pyridoxal 5'-phosphate synthase glutaminase subunit PdxT [Actinomycetota bacterium]